MKKQLLAAAVAATMASVASADISITGAAKVNYTHADYDDASTADTNAFAQDLDIKIKGTSGDTTVVLNLGGIDSTGVDDINVEDNYVSTKIGDVSLKVGAWDNGNNALRASSRGDNKFSASTSFGPVSVTYDASGDAGDDTVKIGVTASDITATYKGVDGGEDVSVKGSFSGINASYLALQKDAANSDRSVWELSGSMNDIGVKVSQASADSSATIDGDTWMGDYEGASGAYALSAGQDVTAIELSTSIAGNTVKFRNVDIDGVAGEDTSFNKVIVTRPLANGTTFEATYTDLDDKGSTTTDSAVLDLELAVKF